MYFLLLVSTAAWCFDCHYDYTVWNTKTRRSEGPFHIQKFRKDITSEEQGPHGCSVCREDQELVKLSNGLRFDACKKMSENFRRILEDLITKGYPVDKVVGYRASVSKGKADARGLRTQFSNHAFGVSLDLNENQNGLYDNCVSWGTDCVLVKGGPYRPFEDLRSLTPDSEAVKLMHKAGLKWGGMIRGKQKDFMHFSPDGY